MPLISANESGRYARSIQAAAIRAARPSPRTLCRVPGAFTARMTASIRAVAPACEDADPHFSAMLDLVAIDRRPDQRAQADADPVRRHPAPVVLAAIGSSVAVVGGLHAANALAVASSA